jgi:allantoicase
MSSTPAPYPHLTNLLSEALGARAIACSDDFFASMHHLVHDADPVFDPDAYYERGKVMDGWESRRKRGPGHDWCILALGAPGVLHAADLDTRHFTGNHAPWASLEAVHLPGDPDAETLQHADWIEILSPVALRLGSHNPMPLRDDRVFTHVRLRIYPDGGVARLRLYGDVHRDLPEEADLAALENGGKALACSDMYFGNMDHLIAPGRADDMRGGWETRRRRGPGEDWVLVRLARRGILKRIVLDTNHFKGNFPDTASVEGIDWQDGPPHELLTSPHWDPVVPRLKLSAHDVRSIDLDDVGPYTHLRLRIQPCGGVSRMRAFGVSAPRPDHVVDRLRDLSDADAAAWFRSVCGSERWVRGMLAARPFDHRGALLTEARRLWWTLGPDDWKEAFAHHPRIGENPERLRERFAHTAAQSSREQAGVQGAPEHVLEALQERNEAYEARFGHVFLICATGLDAATMLHALETRMHNDAERELREAAAQQAAITHLRLLAGVPA